MLIFNETFFGNLGFWLRALYTTFFPPPNRCTCVRIDAYSAVNEYRIIGSDTIHSEIGNIKMNCSQIRSVYGPQYNSCLMSLHIVPGTAQLITEPTTAHYNNEDDDDQLTHP